MRRGDFTGLLAILWSAVILVLGLNSAYGQTAQDIARKAFRSTVLLVTEDASGRPLSLGSGFFVRAGEIATNLHVIEGAARGYAKPVGQKAKYDIEGFIAMDARRDLVILKISSPSTVPLTLGNSEAVEVGEAVYAVGNPQGLEGTFSQGIVSSIRDVGSDKLIQITAAISPGSSGGPVLNSRADVIGVSVATFKEGQNLNFAIPSNYLAALLAKAGPAKPITQAKASTAQPSVLADLGGRSSEGVVAGLLTWNLPGNQFSGSYSFSLRNQLRENVKNVYCLLIFRDSQGRVIDVDFVRYNGLIPAGLAKRTTSRVHASIGVLTEWRESAVEFRILDFEIVR